MGPFDTTLFTRGILFYGVCVEVLFLFSPVVKRMDTQDRSEILVIALKKNDYTPCVGGDFPPAIL